MLPTDPSAPRPRQAPPHQAPPARRGGRARALVAALALAVPGAALAQESAPAPGADAAAAAKPALRICASTREAPYSEPDGAGFENRIAVALAEEMGRVPEFVYADQYAIYQVRDQLDAGACDVVFGVDTDDPRVLTSDPLYRSGYALVSRADAGFESADWEDLRDSGFSRFAIRFHSPAETILKYTGKWEDNAAYLYSLINFKSRRNQYSQVPADRLVAEVASGEADVSIAFAPALARYVRDARVPLRMTLIDRPVTRADGVVIPLAYDQAAGVRQDDTALMAEINAALPGIRDRIDAILAEEGIPTLPTGS